jgi:hypothetical protein
MHTVTRGSLFPAARSRDARGALWQYDGSIVANWGRRGLLLRAAAGCLLRVVIGHSSDRLDFDPYSALCARIELFGKRVRASRLHRSEFWNRGQCPRWRRAHFDPRSALRAQSRLLGEGPHGDHAADIWQTGSALPDQTGRDVALQTSHFRVAIRGGRRMVRNGKGSEGRLSV